MACVAFTACDRVAHARAYDISIIHVAVSIDIVDMMGIRVDVVVHNISQLFLAEKSSDWIDSILLNSGSQWRRPRWAA